MSTLFPDHIGTNRDGRLRQTLQPLAPCSSPPALYPSPITGCLPLRSDARSLLLAGYLQEPLAAGEHADGGRRETGALHPGLHLHRALPQRRHPILGDVGGQTTPLGRVGPRRPSCCPNTRRAPRLPSSRLRQVASLSLLPPPPMLPDPTLHLLLHDGASSSS